MKMSAKADVAAYTPEYTKKKNEAEAAQKKRIAEAAKLGFKRVVLPEQNRKRLGMKPSIEVVGVRHIKNAIEELV